MDEVFMKMKIHHDLHLQIEDGSKSSHFAVSDNLHARGIPYLVPVQEDEPQIYRSSDLQRTSPRLMI